MRASQRAGKTKKGHGGALPVQHSALFVSAPPKVPSRLPQRCRPGARVPPLSVTQVMIGAAVFAVGILAGAGIAAWLVPPV
jgi:hypothetical protein